MTENYFNLNYGEKKVRLGPAVDFTHGRLQVSENGRFLQHADGTPFFFLGDTAWELIKRLKVEEAAQYFENRRSMGFTVINTVVLSEFDGLTTPNAYSQKPLFDNDPTKPNEAYFKYIDTIVDLAYEKGLVIGMLPTWGDKVDLWRWGVGPVIFNENNAEEYGRYIGNRYKNKPNIIWILGGDRSPFGYEDIWRRMAGGIIEGDGGSHLVSYHPIGERSSSQWFHNESWLDFNMLQSGHADRNFDNYSMIAHDYGLSPAKPCMDAEPRYENHAVNWNLDIGRFDGFDVRQAAYWAVFAGAHGHTYGCHDVWQMYAPEREPIGVADTFWHKAVDFSGAWGMLYLRNLIESRPFFSRIPDQGIIAGAHGSGEHHVQATGDKDGSYAFIYVPNGRPVIITMEKLSGNIIKGYWFNPRDGSAAYIGEFTSKGNLEFIPPAEGKGIDWVLVLDDAAKNYPEPGSCIYI
jgi:hypothetical protein